MEEMSKRFQIALSMSDYHKQQAIELYNEEIEENPRNLAAWHNRGLCRLRLAIEQSNPDLLEESKKDITKAISLAIEEGKSYPIAEANLNWANSIAFD